MKRLLNKIRKLLVDRRTRRLWTRVVSTVAAVVVFVTTYALVMPAITMEREAYCGIEAHEHTDDCYEDQLICTIPESPGHRHDESCYTTRQELTCTVGEHTHDNSCYDEEGNLICETPEHVHDGSCFEEVSELTCTLEESEGHRHDAACYEKVLICGKPVHTHSAECYQDPDGQPESAAVAATTEGSAGTGTTDILTDSDNAFRDEEPGAEDDADNQANSSWDVTGNETGGTEENAGVDLSEIPDKNDIEDSGEEPGTAGTTANPAQDLEEDSYVPTLEPLNFDTILNSHSSIYYYPVAEGETVEDSSQISGWKKVEKNTELGPNDLLRVYLSYTIPAGSLNETNPTAAYRLPANLHLTDAQVEAINAIENGIAASYIDYATLTVTDSDNYHRYLGAEAVEGTRTPDQDVQEYLDGLSRNGKDAQEYIGATVRVENVFDIEGIYGEKGAYLGQDLIFTFSPYTIEKNQHTYDAAGQPTRAGEKVRGWLTLDFNLSQVDFSEPWTEEDVESRETIENADVAQDAEIGDSIDIFENEESAEGSENAKDPDNMQDAENLEDEEIIEGEKNIEGGTTIIRETRRVREFQTTDVIFVDADKNLGLEEISTKLLVLLSDETVVSDEVIEPEGADEADGTDDAGNTDEAEVTDDTDEDGNPVSDEAGQLDEDDAPEVSDQSGENDKADDTAKDGEDKDKTEKDDQTEDKDTDKTDPESLMPAMSFEDSIRVSTGKPAGVEDGSAGTAAANAAEALPKKAKVTVRVEADEGTFPVGTTMVLSAVEDMDAVAETVRDAVENADPASGNGSSTNRNEKSAETNSNQKTYGFQAVDISFRDKDGNDIEPAKPVRVALTSSIVEQVRKEKEEDENSVIADPVVVHVDDDGNAETMELVSPDEIEPAKGKTEEELLKELEEKEKETEKEKDKDAAESEKEAEEEEIEENRITEEKDKADQGENEEKDTEENIAAEEGENAEENEAAEEKNTANEPEIEETENDEEADSSEESSTVFFDTDSFSVYAIVYTVDFHWEVNGKTYDFSIPGGGFVSLEHLVEVLGINSPDTNAENPVDSAENSEDLQNETDDNNGEEVPGDGEPSTYEESINLNNVEVSEATKEFVADVESVEFSDPSLVWVGKADADSTVGGLKEANELEVKYSAELTEEQIAEINAQTVEIGDWALISVQPFISEESLTVTMKNGEQFVVKVTDGQIKKTVISASGETYEITVTYDESAQIPDGASLDVSEFAEDSVEYRNAFEAVVAKKLLEEEGFDEQSFHMDAMDISILDTNGEKVEPMAPVEVSVKAKSLAEELVYSEALESLEVLHFSTVEEAAIEKVAAVADGNIYVEDTTVEADFRVNSFSTFTVNWIENTNAVRTTLRWTYGNGNQSRVFAYAYYVDENGNSIQRPEEIGWTVDHWLGDSGSVSVDLIEDLAKSIPGRTFQRAYITQSGQEQIVTNAIGARDNYWNYNSIQYYNGDDQVFEGGNWGQYEAPSITLVYSGDINRSTVHYGYMENGVFHEFEEEPVPTDISTDFGWIYLVYDFNGKDSDGSAFTYHYKGAYYSTTEVNDPTVKTEVAPLLRYRNNRWRYYEKSNGYDDRDTLNSDSNWDELEQESHVYVVYEKPTVTSGGTPQTAADAKGPDDPAILKQSKPNGDGTNTLSLSITGSTATTEFDSLADVIIVLDLSSSMRSRIDQGSNSILSDYTTNHNSRFWLAKNSVQTLADDLFAKNSESGKALYQVGLITFAGDAQIRQELTSNQSVFNAALSGVTSVEGKGTNWEHALQLANEMSTSSTRSTYVIFITDGEPTSCQTRYGLTNVQLRGDTQNGITGNVFNGGQNNGTMPGNYTQSGTGFVYQPFHFYLRSQSFGRTNEGEPNYTYNGQTVNGNIMNREAAYDEAVSIVGHNKNLYTIGVSSDVQTLDQLVDAAGLPTTGEDTHSIVATTGNELESAFNHVISKIYGNAGWGNVNMVDGITSLTNTIAKVNQLENRLIGADGNFTYWRAEAPQGWSDWDAETKAAYTIGMNYPDSSEKPEEYNEWTDSQKDAFEKGQAAEFVEWTTREEQGCAAAQYNTETGAVEWNMGDRFMLEDGVTYKVSFICWPSQTAYDIIAKLKNGTLTMDDLSEEQRKQIVKVGDDDYALKTNQENPHTDYYPAIKTGDTVAVTDEKRTLPFLDVDPMGLTKDKLNVEKLWEASKIDSQSPEAVVLQVWGDNEQYKQFIITPVETTEGSDKPNRGVSEDIFISCGLIKVDKTTGDVVIYESGHDFGLREVEENSRHWDLSASTYRPMVINTVRTMLILVEGNDIPADMTANTNLAYLKVEDDEYYRIDGKVYKSLPGWANISGLNTRRSFLDLAKEVLVDDAVWNDPVDTKFTYKITITVDPTTLSWDPDLEKYIVISIRGENATPTEILADTDYPTTAKLPSQCGFDASNDSRYLIAETGVEFYLSIRNGWSVRFLNLPAGSSYSIEEIIDDNSEYDFKNVRFETRKDGYSVNPDTVNTYTDKTLEGNIEETSTLYKVVYQNEAKAKDVVIMKTSQDVNSPLGGAVFDLYTKAAYESDPKGTPFKSDLESSADASTKGKIALGQLPPGVYYMVETEAPAGYILKTDPVVITVTKDGVTYNDGTSLSLSGEGISQIDDAYQLIVTNDGGVALPNTGGPGTRLFTILGSILVMFAGVLLVRRRRYI